MVNTQTKKMKNKTASEAHESKMKIQNRPKLIKKKDTSYSNKKTDIYFFKSLQFCRCLNILHQLYLY